MLIEICKKQYEEIINKRHRIKYDVKKSIWYEKLKMLYGECAGKILNF